MKKKLISIIAVILILITGYFGYMYYNGPKIIGGVVSKSMDDKGSPVEITTEFSQKETVYFSAKGNRFWIKKAEVVWYKDKPTTENRYKVEEQIYINDAGYFSSSLSAPEGLEEGQYFVGVYVSGRDIVETRITFNVKNVGMEESHE